MCKVNDKFPLVTVIIPTYCRPQYVEIALKFIKQANDLSLGIERWFDELDYYIDNTIKNKYLDCEIINALIEFSEKLITCKRNQL